MAGLRHREFVDLDARQRGLIARNGLRCGPAVLLHHLRHRHDYFGAADMAEVEAHVLQQLWQF